jgi:hypothetical protein
MSNQLINSLINQSTNQPIKSINQSRLSTHGASASTLIHKSKGHPCTLLVIKDSYDCVFGGLITEQIKFHDRDKYYGNGTMGVWSFNTGEAKVAYECREMMIRMTTMMREMMRMVMIVVCVVDGGSCCDDDDNDGIDDDDDDDGEYDDDDDDDDDDGNGQCLC